VRSGIGARRVKSRTSRKGGVLTKAATQSIRAASRWSYAAPFSSWSGLVRHVSAGGIAGLTAGILVGGVGSRVFMRIAGAASGTRGGGRITEAGFTVGELTLGGTIALVVFIGIISGIVGAGMYLAMRPWLGWAGKWRGVVFGILLFGLTSATSDLMNPDNVDFSILGNGPLLVALIIGLFIAFGVVADWVFGMLDRRLPGSDEGWWPVGVVYAVISAIGVMAVLSLGSAILSGGEGICGCEAPVRASWSFLLAFAATAVMWISGIVHTPSWIARTATAAGYLGTIGVFVFGLLRALSDAADIIN
jgi:hypothetical protein